MAPVHMGRREGEYEDPEGPKYRMLEDDDDGKEGKNKS